MKSASETELRQTSLIVLLHDGHSSPPVLQYSTVAPPTGSLIPCTFFALNNELFLLNITKANDLYL